MRNPFKRQSADDDVPRLKPLEVYSDMIAKRIAHGLDDKYIHLADDSLQLGYEMVYSRNSIRCYYYVTMLPAYIDKSFFSVMRRMLDNVKTHHQVFLNYLMTTKPHVIDWNSRDMKERQRLFKLAQKNRTYEGRENFSSQEAKDIDNWEDWRIASWNYVQDADSRLVTLMDTELIFEITVNSRDAEALPDMLKACRAVEQYCAKNKIRIKKVRNTLIDFMRYTSPMAIEESSYSAKSVSNRILSNEILADMCTYTPGKMSDTGILMGIDITTGLPVYKNLVRSGGEAENFLVMAETGGGKSFTMKAVCIQVRLNQFHQIVLDADGEYKTVCQALGGIVIDMSKGNGIYFDSIQIGDLTGVDDIDNSLYVEAQTSTATVFNALCDPDNGMTTTEERLFSDAYAMMLEDCGVIKSIKSSWANSKRCTYHTLYNYIKRLESNPKYGEYKRELKEFVDKLCVFFEPDGLRSYLFQRSISINDIVSRRNGRPMFIDIVLNLESNAMKSKRNSIEAIIKQITATYLITLLTNYFKSLGDFTVHYIEEFQRYSTNANVADLILYMITGNRKRNANTFIITNSPKALLRSSSESAMSVVENINNFVLGAMKVNTIDAVCKEFSLDNCRGILSEIATNDKYKHAFLLKINKLDTTVIRQSIPPHIANTPMFLTRNTLHKVAEDTESSDIYF